MTTLRPTPGSSLDGCSDRSRQWSLQVPETQSCLHTFSVETVESLKP